MNKTYNYPSLIPLSVRMTILAESPMPDSTYETCENWLKTYNNYIYRNSLFFKGPLLYNLTEINENLPFSSFVNIKSYKRNIKCVLLAIQSSGEADEWLSYNFVLYNIAGLQK